MIGLLNGHSTSVPTLWERLCRAEDREMVKCRSPPPGSSSACAETRGSCYGTCLHKRWCGSGAGDTLCLPVKACRGEACDSGLEEWIWL